MKFLFHFEMNKHAKGTLAERACAQRLHDCFLDCVNSSASVACCCHNCRHGAILEDSSGY